MKALDKIVAHLGLADIDYLSARLLILSGLPTTGLGKAAEALEKILKLFFVLFEKIENKKELDVSELKGYGHSLIQLYESYNQMAPEQRRLDPSWKEFMQLLQDAYTRRYPEHWEEWIVPVDIGQLDRAFVYLRNHVTRNFPHELRDRAADFGTFLGDIYTEEYVKRIRNNGMIPAPDVLRINNDSYGQLEIRKGRKFSS